MLKGLMKVLKDNTYQGIHPETESSQITDFTDAVKAVKVNNAGSADTAASATKATQDAGGNVITTSYLAMPNPQHNAGAHNALYRGKDLTSYFNSGEMSKAIAAGTFTDIYPGDYIIKYITVNGVLKENVKWIVGDLDYHLHRGDTETTAHHVLMFSEIHIGNARMNATNTTAGGYTGSEMWGTTFPLYATGIKNGFGSDHVLSHRELLSNAESDSVASMAGMGWNGGTTGWDWATVEANLFNEPMVYGCHPFSSSAFDIGDCNTQVAAMRHDKSRSFTRTYWCWLRAVASSSAFAYADNYGAASYGGASTSDGGVRPYFLLR